MRVKYGFVGLVLAVTACCHVVASNGLGKTYYAATKQIEIVNVLPPPPAAGSVAAEQDLATVLDVQRKRTPAQIASAQADVELSIFRFQSVLGAQFAPANLPYTIKFFEHVHGDGRAVIGQAKDYYHRLRPYNVSPDVKVVVERPGNRSFPSGHTAYAYVTAIVLANMVPEKKAEIFARADEYAWNRVVGGVHFPTDLASGKTAATVIVSTLMQDPVYQSEFTKAKAEVRQALQLH